MQRKVRIRTKIFLIVLVAVLPIVVIALYFALFYQRAYINEKATQITNLCEGFTNEQRLIVRNAEETLLAISQTQAVQERDYRVLNTYLQDLMKVYPDYAVLIVADSSGTVLASGVNKTDITIADRAYFRYAKQTGRFTPGQYIVSRSTGQDAITFTLPAQTRSGDTVYLICSFNLDKYSHELSLDRLPEGATLEIFDYFGIRLFSNSPDEHDDSGSRVSEDLFVHALLASGTSAG